MKKEGVEDTGENSLRLSSGNERLETDTETERLKINPEIIKI